jgi:hypothetical protein
MSNETKGKVTKESEQNEEARKEKERRQDKRREFLLVISMLGALTVLLGFMVALPLCIAKGSDNTCNEKLIDYSKWIITALLAAFGAWIGAGAAYFFGSSNLRESSDSTQKALDSQQKYFKKSRGAIFIKDINLTAMNTNFLFHLKKKAKEVTDKLGKLIGYWFVPVVDPESGILKDIIHSRVFWSNEVKETDVIEDIITRMDEKDLIKFKNLHGDAFYSKVNLNDTIKEVYKSMKDRNTTVAIVIDEKGKPSHCLTWTDLASLMQMQEND